MAQKTRSARKPAPFDISSSRALVPASFAVFALALVVLFSDFIFSGQMMFGSDTLQHGYMFRNYLVDYFHEHGAIPQWIPYYFGGMPYVEAFHGDIFYPLTLLKYVFPLKRMLGWHLILHIFLAGVFMYLCARQLKLDKIPSIVAAACYMFASYFISMVSPGHDGKMYVTAFFPLIIMFLDRGFENRAFFNFTILGALIGLIILTPHPQMSYFSLWGLSFYTAFKLINMWRDQRTVKHLIKPAALTVYAVVLGLLISAIQFFPGYIYTSEFSPRSESKRGWEWAISWSMHEEEAMNLLIPEFSGTSSNDVRTFYWGKNHFKDNCEAVGTITFMLALFGFLFYRRRESYFFGGLAVFTLLYALGATTPVFRLFYWLIPLVDKLRAPSMIMFMFSFSAAILAAMGVQHLVNLRAQKKTDDRPLYRYILFGYPGLLLMLALLFTIDGESMIRLWTSIFFSAADTMRYSGDATKLDAALGNLPSIQSGAWIAFVFSALAAGCMWMYYKGRAGAAVLLAMVGLIVVDGVRFNDRFVSVLPEREYQSRFTANPLVNFFRERDGKFRVLDFGNAKDNTMPFFGVDVTAGYHGNQLRWYNHYLGPELRNLTNPRVVNLTNTEYLIIPANTRVEPDHFGSQPISPVANLGKNILYYNPNAFPRVLLHNRYVVYPDLATIVDSVLVGNNDLRAAVILEEAPAQPVSPDPLGQDSAWIFDYQADTVRIGVRVSADRLLVLADNYYDAWHATIDGQPAEIYRAYGTYRAVVVPQGSRRVEFVFRSSRYEMASMITYVSTIYLVAALGGTWFVRRRRRPSTTEVQENQT